MELNIAGHWILQDTNAQPASHASTALFEATLALRGGDALRALELGSGCGVVSILLALHRSAWRIDALEIQPELHLLAESNARRCGVDVCFREADLCSHTSLEPYGLIISNPPWRKLGSGRLSPIPARNISRFETCCSLRDLLACLQRNLAPSGDALLLYPPDRLQELRAEAKKTFLDIISAPSVAGSREYLICHLRHEGESP